MDATDIQLKRSLKKWVAKHPLPANGRGRLLLEAARPNKLRIAKPTASNVGENPHDLLSWAMVYSLERGVAAMRLVS